jgi:hypothetical protein
VSFTATRSGGAIGLLEEIPRVHPKKVPQRPTPGCCYASIPRGTTMRCEHPRLIRAVTLGAALLVMSACDTMSDAVKHPGSVFRRNPSGNVPQAASGATKAQSDAIAASFKASREECKASVATPELEPIRHKLEFIRDQGDDPLPFEIATNDNFPTSEDRPVIARWATLRDECIRRMDALQYIPAGANDLQITMLKQLHSFGQQIAGDETELIIGLYQQKLTYGEFGRKRYEVGKAAAAFTLAIQQAAAGSNNTQRQLEDLQAAQQQFTDTIDAFSKYVRAVQARKPRTVHMDGSKQATRSRP